MVTTAPFGTWASPITAADTVAGLIAFAELAVDDGRLYWLEMRPSEGGRQVLVHRDAAGQLIDFYYGIGLEDVVTPQRLRGMGAILARVKRHVRDQTAELRTG